MSEFVEKKPLCKEVETMELFKVVSYDHPTGNHLLVNRNGDYHRFDIMVDGDFDQVNPKSLVGKYIFMGYSFPCVSIAMECRVCSDKEGL